MAQTENDVCKNTILKTVTQKPDTAYALARNF